MSAIISANDLYKESVLVGVASQCVETGQGQEGLSIEVRYYIIAAKSRGEGGWK